MRLQDDADKARDIRLSAARTACYARHGQHLCTDVADGIIGMPLGAYLYCQRVADGRACRKACAIALYRFFFLLLRSSDTGPQSL